MKTITEPAIDLVELGFPWHGLDSFILTVHHVDLCPASNDRLGPQFQLGPFVMNSAEELRQAVEDYHRTQFGWPWSQRDPVHARNEGRFAIHADGRIEHRD
ncbi:MAG TPA: pirin-like C-terminal cupin domain-containing protein, partial [Acidimicrobiia bacterium]